MRRYLILLPLIFALFLFTAVHALAADAEPSHVTITVVMPDAPGGESPPALPEIPEPAPVLPEIPKLYPSNVHETVENGVRWVIKTYELEPHEDPADIPRGSFERDAGSSGAGWLYSLIDITKKETAAADVRANHTETVTLDTETKDMEAILRQLAPTMEFTSEDGYTGVLTLDISSIAVETAGTKTTSYTASVTREYPHLSSNDTSLVPKTVTDGDRTLTLASVDWKTNYSMTVDYEQIPASYTAVATYTAPASRTTVTGYTTTAEYTGQLSKLNPGKTVYTAYFAGKEIMPERIPLEIVTPAPEPAPEPEVEPGDGPEETHETPAAAESNPLLVIIPIVLFALLIGVGGGYYIPRILKNKKEKGDKAE